MPTHFVWRRIQVWEKQNGNNFIFHFPIQMPSWLRHFLSVPGGLQIARDCPITVAYGIYLMLSEVICLLFSPLIPMMGRHMWLPEKTLWESQFWDVFFYGVLRNEAICHCMYQSRRTLGTEAMHVVSLGASFIRKGVWNPNQECSKGRNASWDSYM